MISRLNVTRSFRNPLKVSQNAAFETQSTGICHRTLGWVDDTGTVAILVAWRKGNRPTHTESAVTEPAKFSRRGTWTDPPATIRSRTTLLPCRAHLASQSLEVHPRIKELLCTEQASSTISHRETIHDDGQSVTWRSLEELIICGEFYTGTAFLLLPFYLSLARFPSFHHGSNNTTFSHRLVKKI